MRVALVNMLEYPGMVNPAPAGLRSEVIADDGAAGKRSEAPLLWSCGEDRLRCFQSAGQRRLDRTHIRAGIERLAGNEYRPTIRFSQGQLRCPCLRRSIGIGAAGEPVVAPVDRPRRDEVPPDAIGRQIENLAER